MHGPDPELILCETVSGGQDGWRLPMFLDQTIPADLQRTQGSAKLGFLFPDLDETVHVVPKTTVDTIEGDPEHLHRRGALSSNTAHDEQMCGLQLFEISSLLVSLHDHDFEPIPERSAFLLQAPHLLLLTPCSSLLHGYRKPVQSISHFLFLTLQLV